MKMISKPQLAKIHILLNQNGWIKYKANIVADVTSGRAISSKELTYEEARNVIRFLSEHNPVERIKSLIFSLGYQAGILYGSSPDDKKMNAAKLDMFLNKSGTIKKNLNAMNYYELVKTEKQFIAIVRSVNKSKSNREAEKVVHGLLDELDIKRV